MKRYTDLKNNLGPVAALLNHPYFLLTLSATVIALMFLGAFDSANFISITLGILVGVTLAERIPDIPARPANIGTLDKIATAFLISIGFEILFSTLGRGLFPLVYIAAPVLFFYLGWQSAASFIAVTAVLHLALHTGGALPLLRILALPVAAFLPPHLVETTRALTSQKRLSTKPTATPPPPRRASLASAGESLISHSGEIKPRAGSPFHPSRDSTQPFNGALHMLSQLISFNTAALYLKSEDGLFEIEDSITYGQTPIDSGQRLHFRSGYLGWALKTRTPMVVGDVKNPGENLVYYLSKNKEIKSLIVIPLTDQPTDATSSPAEVMGFLVVDSPLGHAFGERETLVAGFIAEAIIEKAKLIAFAKRAEKNSQSLATFYELSRKLGSTLEPETIMDSVIESLADIMEADFIGITLRDEDGTLSVLHRTGVERIEAIEGMKIPHANTLLGLVADTGKYFFTPDLSSRERFKQVFGKEIDFALRMNRTKTLLIVPLHDKTSVERQALGCIVISKSTPNAFNPDQRRLAEIICRDAAPAIANSVSYQRAKEMAATDSLTGLYNLRRLHDELARHIERYEKSSTKISVLLVDIDRFKHFNDTFGHQVGDEAIKAVAEAIAQAVGSDHIAARYGGDEFAILLRDATQRHAREIAGKIIENVKKTDWMGRGIEISLTVSIGISTFPDDAFSREILLRKADRALYKAKHLGRNTFIHIQDIEEG